MWETAIDSPKKVTVINKPAVTNKSIISRDAEMKGKLKESNRLCGKRPLTPPKR